MMTRFVALLIVKTLSRPSRRMSAPTLLAEWATAARPDWAHFDDWRMGSVDALAEALVDGRDPSSAARRLGGERAEAGVGIGTGLSDLARPYRLLLRREPPHEISREFAEGWAEIGVETLIGRPMVDPISGFVTIDYLFARLGEIYSSERPVSDSCFILVDCGAAHASRPDRVIRRLGVANVMRRVFSSGETLGVLPTGLFIVIASRGVRVEAQLDQLHAGLRALDVAGKARGRRIRAWQEALPRRRSLAESLITSLVHR